MKTKEILKEWRTFLIKEYNAGRVKSMIDDLEDYRCKIIINDMGDSVNIIYGKDKDSKYDRLNKQDLNGSISCISSHKMFKHKAELGGSLQGIGKGETNSTWYITLTRDTTSGMGPLLYEVLIEYISSRKNAALKPDPAGVSDDAKRVWEIFDQRSDITQIQLDVDDETVGDYNHYSHIKLTQLTDDHSDDTQQSTAIDDKGTDNWSQSALSRAYRKDKTDLIEELRERELIIETT